MNRILVVDDERSMRDLLALMLSRGGYDVEVAESGVHARKRLEQEDGFHLMISDISMPGMTGVELLRFARETVPEMSVILMTAYGSKETAIEALNEGAAYYVEKPFDLNEMKVVVRKTLEQRKLAYENRSLKTQNDDLRHELAGTKPFSELIGRSACMAAIFELVERVAPTLSTITISGESGTGKELIARAVHAHSPRADQAFVSINCGALPDELLESELFGHLKGAFTSANADKKGLFEAANGGTIFLDEIGETTPATQIKLLRVLQERKIRPVGGTKEIPVDVRVITATNQDLAAMVEEKAFREDLYYRIQVIPIEMPSLRDKREDIPSLAEHFLRKCAERLGRDMVGISKEAMERLESYDWPGNVRQLENVLERAVTLESGTVIQPLSLPAEIRGASISAEGISVQLLSDGLDLELHLEEARQKYMFAALERCGGVQTRAAEMLGMTFRSFRYFAKKYGLTTKNEESHGQEVSQ